MFSVALFAEPTKGRVMLAKLLQPLKALEPMLVTLSGMVMLVKLLQPEKASEPMLVIPSDRVMLAKLLQL